MEAEEEIKRQSSGSEDEEDDLPPMLETADKLEPIEANTTTQSIPTNLMTYDSSSDEEKSKQKVSNICDDLEELD